MLEMQQSYLVFESIKYFETVADELVQNIFDLLWIAMSLDKEGGGLISVN
jgi:hypothetical protein